MPDQTPEALAKWHDERAGELEGTANRVVVSMSTMYLARARKHRATAALLREQAAERERIVAALNLDGASLGPGSEATTDDILRRIAEWRDDREQAWAELAELRAVVERVAATFAKHSDEGWGGFPDAVANDLGWDLIESALAAKEASRG